MRVWLSLNTKEVLSVFIEAAVCCCKIYHIYKEGRLNEFDGREYDNADIYLLLYLKVNL